MHLEPMVSPMIHNCFKSKTLQICFSLLKLPPHRIPKIFCKSNLPSRRMTRRVLCPRMFFLARSTANETVKTCSRPSLGRVVYVLIDKGFGFTFCPMTHFDCVISVHRSVLPLFIAITTRLCSYVKKAWISWRVTQKFTFSLRVKVISSTWRFGGNKKRVGGTVCAPNPIVLNLQNKSSVAFKSSTILKNPVTYLQAW